MSALDDALAALFDCAPRTLRRADHLTTRIGADDQGCFDEACDRADCGDRIRCETCDTIDNVRAMVSACAWCGSSALIREPRSQAWEDLPHADSLRAANAAHEARR